MSDSIDRAQAREALDRDLALRAHARRGAPPVDVRDTCIDCGEPIEPERLRVLGATERCADCAKLHEARQRMFA